MILGSFVTLWMLANLTGISTMVSHRVGDVIIFSYISAQEQNIDFSATRQIGGRVAQNLISTLSDAIFMLIGSLPERLMCGLLLCLLS